jgi:uncharacterized OB-fold protein
MTNVESADPATQAMPGAIPRSLASLACDVWTEPFWEAAAQHRLLCARCGHCGRHRMPPNAFCPHCRSQEIVWDELSGRGTIFTFTIIRHPVIPAVRNAVPYVVAVIDLEGAPGARLVVNVVNADESVLAIDGAVTIVWDDCPGGITVPRAELVSR